MFPFQPHLLHGPLHWEPHFHARILAPVAPQLDTPSPYALFIEIVLGLYDPDQMLMALPFQALHATEFFFWVGYMFLSPWTVISLSTGVVCRLASSWCHTPW